MKINLFGVPPDLAADVNAILFDVIKVDGTEPGVTQALFSRNLATTPATCGEAIDVPFHVAEAVELEFTDDVIATPGAITSTHFP